MAVLNDKVALSVLTKQSATFEIGGKEFVMKPLVLKKINLIIEFIKL